MAIRGYSERFAGGWLALEILRLELLAQIDRPARYHEDAISAVMNGLRIFGRRCHMGFHHLPNEQVVLLDHALLDQSAFEIRVAFFDERRLHLGSCNWRQAELLELIDACTRTIANADNFIDKIDRWHVDDALLALPYHLKAVIPFRDQATKKCRRELQHHVPTHRH